MGHPASHRPSFDKLVAAYPSPKRYTPSAVKNLVGGAVDDTKAPPAQQWLGGSGGDTCTIRMSRALNYSGVPIPSNFTGFRTVKGRDGFNYGFAVQELHKWLLSRYGRPDIVVKHRPIKRDAFAGRKGIIVFDITFGLNAGGTSRALGHADLWDGSTFYDEVAGLSTPARDFFTIADGVSLWVCPGKASLPTT